MPLAPTAPELPHLAGDNRFEVTCCGVGCAGVVYLRVVHRGLAVGQSLSPPVVGPGNGGAGGGWGAGSGWGIGGLGSGIGGRGTGGGFGTGSGLGGTGCSAVFMNLSSLLLSVVVGRVVGSGDHEDGPALVADHRMRHRRPEQAGQCMQRTFAPSADDDVERSALVGHGG